MPKRHLAFLFIIGFFAACTSNIAIQPPNSTEALTPVAVSETSTPEITTSAVPLEGNPADKVAAFYYPWYGNPETDGKWIHWDQNIHVPPDDIGADYYPALGVVSSKDLALQIDRGDIGKTQVVIYNHLSSIPVEVKTFEWDQVTTDRNSHQIAIPSELLTVPTP